MSWFESFVDQSVTYTSWRKIEGKVCQLLKQNLEKKLMDPVHRQLLFQILGNDFVNKYFSSYTSSPAILDNVRSEEKEKKMSEMKNLVASIIDGAVQKKGSKSDTKLQSDLSTFSGDIKKLITSDFEDQFAQSKSKKKSNKGDLPEKYLSEILMYDPNAINYILPTLQSQTIVLSDSLRRQVWPVCINSKEKVKNVRNSEKVKERFLQLYNRLSESDDSYDDTISTAVSEMFKSNQSLKSLDSEGNRNSTTLILTVCNTHGKKFQSQYVPYAIVMQQIYLKNSKSTSEEDFALASMMTEKILRLCMINNENSKKVVDKVFQELNEFDEQFMNHINSTLSKKLDSDNSSSHSSKKKRSAEASSFVNKWILTGFVPFLKPHCVLFVWDQLFYHKWENKIIHQICITLLGLLKPWFMCAKQSKDIEKVFTEEPGYLYILDIRQAFMHVQRKGKFSEIPRMNRNIKFEKQEPAPVLPPPPPRIPTPPPPKIPTPPPKKTFIPWVPYDKAKVKDTKITKSKLDFPFDLYVDAVRFVPDNATFIKITGKVLNMYISQKEKSIKFQAYPELDSPWRYPNFKLKQTINKENIPMNPDVVIMMRVYTIEKHSKKNCVLGSCLFGPFSNKHGKQAGLRTGGHQIRVRHGIPDPDFTVEHMLASHMDDNPLIPGVTILLRVLPHSNDYVNAPEYETNVYRSELAKPNESEKKLYKHYEESKNFSKTVQEITLLQMGQASANDNSVKQYIQQQLQKEGGDVEDFPYQRYVDYNKEYGIQLLADKASGLPIFLEGRYLQCLVQIFPGEDSKIGNGKSQVASFVTEELELDSPQRAPDWSDQPKRIKAEYDDRAFILVSLYGLRPKYDSVQDKILNREGKEPKFSLQHAIAWSAVRCFDKDAVFAGVHQIPLLKGRPSDDVIEKLSYLPLDYIVKKFKSEVKVFEAASIEISVWDGHFINSECPPLPFHTDLLNISPNPQRYIKAAENPKGATAADLLKQGLNNPSEYSNLKRKMVEMLKMIFKNSLDAALTGSGFLPMI